VSLPITFMQEEKTAESVAKKSAKTAGSICGGNTDMMHVFFLIYCRIVLLLFVVGVYLTTRFAF